jgi:hypothetical protein
LRGLFILPAARGFVNAAKTAAFWAKNGSVPDEQGASYPRLFYKFYEYEGLEI